jgi:hypothetical protein
MEKSRMRLSAFLIFLGFSLCVSNCGVKGPPLPPIVTTPQQSEPNPKPTPTPKKPQAKSTSKSFSDEDIDEDQEEQ